MFILENKNHEQIGKILNNLRAVQRPDGGISTNVKVDEEFFPGLWCREVARVTEGEGPRVLSHSAPAWDGSKWVKIKTLGPALPPAPDPVPGDEDYDYKFLRERDYPKIGDQLDAIWKELQPAPGSEAESMKNAIAAVKAKHPKPEA